MEEAGESNGVIARDGAELCKKIVSQVFDMLSIYRRALSLQYGCGGEDAGRPGTLRFTIEPALSTQRLQSLERGASRDADKRLSRRGEHESSGFL